MRKVILAMLVSAPFVVAADGANLSVGQYWELTKARLELAALEWRDRIASAEQAQGNRETLIANSGAIAAQYAIRHNQLLAKFGVSQQAYLHFATDHSREIESYLEENADLKRVLDNLRKNIQSLIQRLDSIVGPVMMGGAPK